MKYVYLIAYTFRDSSGSDTGRIFISFPEPLTSVAQVESAEEQIRAYNDLNVVGILSFQLLEVKEA